MEALNITINPEINHKLPRTYEILKSSQLTVHPYVYKVVLTGSRGLAGNYREDSDIDLSLLVDRSSLKPEEDEEKVFNEIINTVLLCWKSTVELDTVVLFDINGCNLNCFDSKTFEERTCNEKGIDCMGLYKTQKGFKGYVPKIGIDIQRIYPMITVWERKRNR